jgi:glutathione S-transferase
MAIQLFAWPRSSATRISWALEELGLPYEYVELDARKLEHRTPRYLALHPQGKVPALIDGKLSFFESGAIMLHLGRTYGVQRKLWPEDGGQPAADALSLTVWAMTELGNHMMQYLYHGLDTPVSYQPEDRSKAAAEYSHAQFVRCLDALAARLDDGREHLLGGFTLVDIACSSWLLRGAMFGISLAEQPRVAAWVTRCAERPALEGAR